MKLLLALCLLSALAFAGGPLSVGGPQFGLDGQAFKWDVTAPVQYHVDSGPLSATVGNTAALARVQAAFANWSSVPTTSISFQNAGPISPTGAFAGGDVRTVSDYNAVIGACNSGAQSSIIFDADASIFTGLGLPAEVIGFASPCMLDSASGHIVSAFVALNGTFQDGINSGNNLELTPTQFDQAMTHEFGHFLGLDHAQINNAGFFNQNPCSADQIAGRPVMFPVVFCPAARVDDGFSPLSADDAAWVSFLYPNANFNNVYGVISGFIYFIDGKSGAQGVNVIARSLDDPNTPQDESQRAAFSAVSGLYFTGNPGQTVTGDNPGSRFGSRQGQLAGYYEIPVLPGNYTVQVESVDPSFVGGSSVGPLRLPISMPGPPEFWDLNESGYDDPATSDALTISAGQKLTAINIILNFSYPRFDSFEDGLEIGLLRPPPFLPLLQLRPEFLALKPASGVSLRAKRNNLASELSLRAQRSNLASELSLRAYRGPRRALFARWGGKRSNLAFCRRCLSIHDAPISFPKAALKGNS